MWLVRRVIVLVLALAVLCAGTVVVARANPTPSRLQALGFDVCDGEPCWHGIKPGMDASLLQNKGQDLRKKESYLEKVQDNWIARVNLVRGSSIVASMSIHTPDISTGLPVTAGDIVAKYGVPCRVFRPDDVTVHLIFPYLDIAFSRNSQVDMRMGADSHPFLIALSQSAFFGGCARASDSDKWHGFTSDDVYDARYRRARAEP